MQPFGRVGPHRLAPRGKQVAKLAQHVRLRPALLHIAGWVGALIVLAETKDADKRAAWAKRGAAFFRSKSRRSAPTSEGDIGGAPATGIRRYGRGMIYAPGKLSAASARDI
ncbi:hypothetical protein DUT91_22265 [Phyllobacterium salinisoli]|uniref:Conjugal transfer protein TraD n=1 Tax=Phyllobacterium salinisoli TaxID=1899321 RepID=A0A368K143_9HYPH|nr:hypothetical protein DUT91_22265 [Phyllobacterium salinisoli]